MVGMLTRRRLAAAIIAVAATGSSALAIRAPRARIAHDYQDSVALPAAGVAKLRAHPEVAWGGVPAARTTAWQRLRTAAPGLSHVSWDVATQVPSRIWGRGVDVPGSVASADIAAAAAWRFLLDHLDLLAPGAAITDFELVANDLDGDYRTVGMIQRHAGLPVVGGQISFRFKRDRLFVIGSEALPDVRIDWPRGAMPPGERGARAQAAIATDLAVDPARVTAAAPGTYAIVPLIGERGVLGYRLAVPVEVDAGPDGRYQLWTDPQSGAPLVRRALHRYASGTVQFDAVVRWPGRPRQLFPAPGLQVTVAGATATTGADGQVTWTGGNTNLMTTVRGPLVEVDNLAGETATTSMAIADGGRVTWSPGDDRELDAQLSAYIHAQRVKEYVRGFAPQLGFLDELLPVKVNIADECNAFSNGTAIHFFKASEQCENTATLADVVYHEFGHSMHSHSLIPGAGFFDGAFSEGLSDYLAATITNDSAMGRGFFKNDEPLRELDPPDREYIWPRDVSEIHATGMIFAGAMWDLRKGLVAELGPAAGVAVADRLFYAAVRRAASIPATLVEILAADDDDGDLTNGTPHECTIRAAFGRHGLRTIGGDVVAPGTIAGSTEATTVPVALTLVGEDHHCGDEVSGVALEWRPRGNNTPTIVAALHSDGAWRVEMPVPADGKVVQHRMRVQFTDGSDMLFPDNRADPWFELYRGDVMPLYCTDFESDPFSEGWRADDGGVWQWGLPGASPGTGDPGRAWSGTRVLGTGLSTTRGTYPPRAVTWVETPEIDVGRWSDVRLHYRRWLGVEDGYFDHATISVNGEQAWANLSSRGNNNKTQHHEDRAWIFNDLGLSSRIQHGKVKVRWSIDADEGFELGGWTLDDVCIVANLDSVCGDGRVSGAEQCDLGNDNADVADTCRTNCRVPVCGDGIADALEQCDDGNDDPTDGCDDDCMIVDLDPGDPGGCCASSRGPGGNLIAIALAMLGVLRPWSRRRRAR